MALTTEKDFDEIFPRSDPKFTGTGEDLPDDDTWGECTNIPYVVWRGFKNYVVHGRAPGHFVRHCLENQLVNAVCEADQANFQKIREICQFMHCQLPQSCWGNKQAVKDWLEKKRKERDA